MFAKSPDELLMEDLAARRRSLDRERDPAKLGG